MFEIKPDLSLGPLDFPGKESGLLRPSDEALELNSNFGLTPGGMHNIRVKTGFYTINAHVNTKVPGDRLFIMLHGARKLAKNKISANFWRYNWDTLYPGPILAISDPMSEATRGEDTMRSSGFTGTFEHDLTPELNVLIDAVCDQLGIPRDRVVFYGCSSGGTASILTVANREAGGDVIAVCPALRPDKFKDNVLQAALKVMGGDEQKWHEMRRMNPTRFNPIDAIQHTLTNGGKVRYVVSQCLEDGHYMNKHIPYFQKRLDIDEASGIDPSGKVFLSFYHNPEGHGHEPDILARPLLKAALDFFDGKITKPAPVKAGAKAAAVAG